MAAARSDRLARCLGRSAHDRSALQSRTTGDRFLSRQWCDRVDVRCGGIVRRIAALAVLLGADLSLRRGIHMGECPTPRRRSGTLTPIAVPPGELDDVDVAAVC